MTLRLAHQIHGSSRLAGRRFGNAIGVGRWSIPLVGLLEHQNIKRVSPQIDEDRLMVVHSLYRADSLSGGPTCFGTFANLGPRLESVELD